MPRKRDEAVLQKVGRRVGRVRRERGWTQERLAEAIGIEPVTLSRLETGDRAASLSTLAEIAHRLGVAMGDLIDDARPAPAPRHAADTAELVRAFRDLSARRKRLVLGLVRELSSK